MKSGPGYEVGLTVMVIGIVAAVGWWLGSLLVSTRDDPKVSVSVAALAESTVELEARKYDVNYEFPSSSRDDEVPTFTLQVLDAQTGAEIPVARSNGSVKTTGYGSRSSKQGTLTPPHAGSYLIVTTTQGRPAAGRVSLEENLDLDNSRAIRGAITIGLIINAAGLLLIVLTACRLRRRPFP